MKHRVRPYNLSFPPRVRWCIERKHWWGWGVYVKGFYGRRDAEVEMANLLEDKTYGR
jgi:hypothetical protein